MYTVHVQLQNSKFNINCIILSNYKYLSNYHNITVIYNVAHTFLSAGGVLGGGVIAIGEGRADLTAACMKRTFSTQRDDKTTEK